MTKQKKIQEAYGEYADIAQEICDENGWIGLINYYTYFPIENQKSPCGNFRRPKSLQGIENNNSWVKIESEEDFPKEKGDYFICVDGVQPNNNIMHLYQLVSHCRDGLISHYKPVIKPNEPIY